MRVRGAGPGAQGGLLRAQGNASAPESGGVSDTWHSSLCKMKSPAYIFCHITKVTCLRQLHQSIAVSAAEWSTLCVTLSFTGFESEFTALVGRGVHSGGTKISKETNR